MAQNTSGPYDLRARHTSQPSINAVQDDNEPDSLQHLPQRDATKLSPLKEDNQEPPEQHKKSQLAEVPVIRMEDFQQVDMNEKLDLLMSAINKINTNFHHNLRTSILNLMMKLLELFQGYRPLSRHQLQ